MTNPALKFLFKKTLYKIFIYCRGVPFKSGNHKYTQSPVTDFWKRMLIWVTAYFCRCLDHSPLQWQSYYPAEVPAPFHTPPAELIVIKNYLVELFKVFGFSTNFLLTVEGTFVSFKLTNFHVFQPQILTPKIIDQI